MTRNELARDAKELFNFIKSNMNMLQRNGYLFLPYTLMLHIMYRDDLANFILYQIMKDEKIDLEKVELTKFLTDYGKNDIDGIYKYAQMSDLLSFDYKSWIPMSLKYLISATCNARLFGKKNLSFLLEDYIRLFVTVGKIAVDPDGDEKTNFEVFIKNMISYTREFTHIKLEDIV